MTSSRSRRNRNRRRTFNGNPADHDDTQWIGRLRTEPGDGATYEEPPAPWRPTGERFADPSTWRGANDLGGDQAAIDRIREAQRAAWDSHHHFGGGLPGGIAYLAAVAVKQTGQDTQPLARLRAEPRYAPASAEVTEEEAAPLALLRAQAPAPVMFPALPVAAPAPASAEAAEPAVIGDALRLPVIWCDMPRCISFHHDPASAGYADTRERAMASGWRYDARGLFACPECQQTRSDYRTPQPLAWHHKEVARRWHSGEPLGEEAAFRLGVVAEYCRRISREHPEWAEAMAGATARHRRTAGAS